MNATQFYEIKSWLDGSVLFSGQFGSLKLCVEAAVSAKVSFARASLDGANLYGATLDGATLVGANLDGANLARATLVGATLYGATLVGANLVGANLDGASLDGANLARATLVGATLVDANLVGANLDGASLDGATLVGANDIIMLGQPDGWRAYAYRAKTTIRVQVGCQNKTLSKGREYWADKPDRREVLAALDYAEKVAGLRGWTFGEEG
ncbi:Pentapeptide repeat [uncultured Caudovirales phage]|uniref:Pentapeptide repeat n=1 Tax=uncultured Caudovirales phage TaxID=2100421 RepID=A0A6J5P4I3_9CAUD|nr:Pentapeptide repeat [uncultured Caudovirales phage]